MRGVRSVALAFVLVCATAGSGAQIAAEDPDWRESALSSPPTFNLNRLVNLEAPAGSTLKFGIDPATLSVTPEGIVRYVMVATSPSGARNVMYEGIRCTTAQHRVYARHHPESGWSLVRGGEWHALAGSASTRHALALATAGACTGRSANRSAPDIVRALEATRQAD